MPMTEQTTKMNITVPASIPERMAKIAGGERKKGAWLTTIIESIEAGQGIPAVGDIETLRLQVVGLNAELNSVKAQLRELRKYVGQTV